MRFLIGSSIFYLAEDGAGYQEVCQGTGAFCYLFDYKGKEARTSRGVSTAGTSSKFLTCSAIFLPLFCFVGISMLIPNELLLPTSVGNSSEIAKE